MESSTVLGEEYVSKVGAVFSSPSAAREAADDVTRELALGEAEVRVVEPGDRRESRKLEPESRGIARTLVRAHVVFGCAGAIAGALLSAVLLLTGAQLFTASPGATLLWLTAFGAVAGLLLGGLVSLRPDHDRLNMNVEEATRDEHQWALIVHVRDQEHAQRARSVLERHNGHVISTL